MEHRQKRLTKIGFLAIFLVAFVALFGFAADASAALCTSSTHTGNPVWKAVDFTCDVFYEDPGGAGLAECEYRFYNIDTGVYVPSSGWWTASGTCSGDSATLQASVFVGTIQDCRNNGLDKCRLEWRAEDNAHNESQGTVTHFDIDYFPPSGGFISYTNGFIIQTSVSLTVNDGTDPHSGVNTATRTTQRRSATLSSGVCGSYGSFATFSPTGMYPDFTDSTLASATCYQYRYLVSDNAGNQATYTSANEVKVDAIKPELDAFSADRTFLNIVNPTVTFSWTIEDFGGSGLKQIELWRKAPGGGWLPHDTDTFPSGQGPVSGQFQDTPTANGTYEYGVHVLDEAGNQCDEGGTGGGGPGGCAGTYGAAGTKFVEVEKTAPTGSIIINGGAPYTTSTSVILSLTCNDDGVACDASDTMNISGDCTFSGAYSSSLGCTLTSGDGLKTVSVRYTDGAGNQSSMYSDTITLDTTPPNTTITDAPPDPSFVDTASFSFTSTESGTFQCQLDGGGYSSCTSPKNYSGLSQATHTFLVKAIDLAGNEDPTPASHTWQVILNLAPSISSVNDSPDPIGVGSQITFQVFWSDPDGDSTRIHICKTDSISGQTCSGGSWCDTASFSSSSPTSCNYTTQGGDAGQKSYWAFACDNGSPNLCSPSQSGTFLVDATAPSISSFTASPAPPAWISNGAPNATVDWSVSDTGGSNLKQIEVWRAWDQNGDDILQPGEWDNPGNGQNNPVFTKSSGFDTPSTDTDSYIDTNLLATATYWYGLHVLDNASNLTTESTPREVQVDKLNPVAVVTDPTPGDWYRDDFTATFDDSDLGSGLATNCEYEFIGLNPGGGDTTSGTLTRDCNLDTGLIGVGESPEVCQFEGASRCRVRTQAYDLAGNTSGWQPFDYGVDFTDPSVGTPGPSTAQAGVSQTYSSSLSDPVGKVASCTFFWKVSGAPEWNTGGATTIDPVPCENGGMCSVSVDHTFASSGDYDISFGCADSTLPLPANTGWGFGAVSTDSLSVTLTANPPSGVTTTLFDLTSQVAGTASGLANFKFDCTNDSLWEYEIDDINLSSTDPGWVLRNGYNTKVTAPDTFAVQDLCQYGTPDTYTANALVERGNGDAGDTADITVTPNTAPQAINLAHNNGTADYCFVSSPPIILSWTFDDDDPGDSQSAYQVQMATDAGFSNIVVDTNKVTSSNTQFSPVGLMYATTYHWRVKVWDNNDAESVPEWATGASFTTPVHAYPSPNFSWVPVFPSAEEEIQFTEDTTFAPGSTGQGWSWTFGDTGSSLLQNPTHVYAENGAYLVTLEVTDDAGSCSREKTVTVTLPFPEWQEISPF